MKTTIILAHPWHGSFNKAILDTTLAQLKKRNKAYQVIDLNMDNFDPVLGEGDLALFSKGQYKDPQVGAYQNMLKESDEVVFIFPIWWFDAPAILKGFLDKVMLKDFAYTEASTGLKGLLTHVQRTTVITTSEVPTWYLKFLSGNPIQATFIRRTLHGIGLKNAKWINSDYTSTGKASKRKRFLDRISARFAV